MADLDVPCGMAGEGATISRGGGLPEAAGLMDVITGLDLRRLAGHENPIALTFVRPFARNQTFFFFLNFEPRVE